MKSINVKSFKLFLLGGLLACGLLPALASATPVKFDINGHYSVSDYVFPGGDFSGTMKVDTEDGELLSFNVTFPGLAEFNGFSDSFAGILQATWTVWSTNEDGAFFSLTFGTPAAPCLVFVRVCLYKPGSLVDFAGGSIDGDLVMGPNWGLPNRLYLSGDITPAQVSVPEPASLGVFGAGMLLVGLFAGLRRRFE
jgi:hypothetical protein